jgi:hypothetical protein
MMMMTSASPSGGDGGVAGSLSEVQRATGSSTAIAKFCRSPACFLSGISGWRDGVLYPLAGGSRRIRRGAFWLWRRDALLDLLAARW